MANDVIYGNSIDSLRYDLEEELATEDIIGSAINKINNHVEVNLGDNSLTLNNVLVDAKVLKTWGGTNQFWY